MSDDYSDVNTNVHSKLAPALVAMQAKYTTIVKNKEVEVTMKSGGKFKYQYATLDHILDEMRPLLKAHDFAVTNTIKDMDLHVTLMHSSGQFLTLALPLHTTADPKALGSELTYMRRYGIACLLGLATEDDDDGQRASYGAKAAPKKNPRPQRGKGQKTDGENEDAKPGIDKRIQMLWINLRETEKIMQHSIDPEWSGEEWIRAKMEADFGKESSKELTIQESNKLMMALKKMRDDNTPPE